jgi:phage terminase large subunit-like protein
VPILDATLKRFLKRMKHDVRVVYRPSAVQQRFHACGAEARERLFLAGNRVGKTVAGSAEMVFHLTGRYPAWWRGIRFNQPIDAWAASVTREATRDILQKAYLGTWGEHGWHGGFLPPWALGKTVLKSGVAGAVDTVQVRHSTGGWSVLGFKSFDQGRESFQGTAREVIHLDEEPPLDVYEECLLRTMTVQGHVMLTMTPLLGMTEMVRHFVGEPDPERAGKALVRAGWDDAPHLTSDDKKRLRASLRPHELAARECGEPRLGSGLVFALDETEIKVPRFKIPPGWRWCFGLDFGWHNPTAAVWLAEDPVTHEIGRAHV